MKKTCLLALLGAISVLMAGCATVSYTKLPPLTEEEKQAITCEQIQVETNAAKSTIEDIGEVRTSDKVASGAGVGLAMLRATLGGFDGSDFQNIANVKEQTKAIEKAQFHLAQLQELHTLKDCPEAISDDAPTADLVPVVTEEGRVEPVQ